MRFVFYAIAWGCCLCALILAEFTVAAGLHSKVIPAILLLCGSIMGGFGYLYTRRTTRQCPHCGERSARIESVCGFCTGKLWTVRGDL